MSLRTPFLAIYCLLSVALPLYGADTNDLTWVVNGDGISITITDCDEAATGALVIPEIIEDKVVTAIGSFAFMHCTSLASIIIPDSVTSIGSYAFYECTSLVSITLPASLTSIGHRAFFNCTSLTNISIPDGVTSIEDWAFYRCTSLSGITLPDSVTSIGEKAFFNCTSLTNISIPDGVTSIEDSAFLDCTSLASINIPDSVISIGVWAFESCTSLTSATIGNSVISIGHEAFRDCTSLSSITLPDSVTSIGYGAFRGCTSLASATIGNSVASIGDQAFNNCTSLLVIDVLPGNLAYASEDGVLFNASKTALVRCPEGRGGSYLIPASVTSIGEYAFNNCQTLASITIPNSVIGIGYGAFYRCTSLVGITIPASVTSIGASAFSSCTSLIRVNMGGNAPLLGSSAFSNVDMTAAVYVTPGATGFSSTFGGLPVIVDTTPPQVSSIVVFGSDDGLLASEDASNDGSYAVTVSFSEAVEATPAISSGGSASYNPGSFTSTDGGITWTATHDGFTGDGTMTIDLAIGTATDLLGNSNAVAATPFVLYHDSSPPQLNSILILGSGDGPLSNNDYSNDGSYMITLSFSEAVEATPGISSGGTANYNPGSFTTADGGVTWTATHDVFTGDGTMSIDLGLGAAWDLVGNSNTVAATPFVVHHDTTPPATSLLGANPQQVERGTAYSELNATAVDDTGGDISGTIVIDSTAVDTATAGSYTVTYNVQDAAGNTAAEVTRTVVVVTPEPQVISIAVLGSDDGPLSSGDASNDDSYTVAVSFSERVEATPGISSGGSASYSPGSFTTADNGVTWTATHNNFTEDGTMTIDLAVGEARDLAGNLNTVAATQFILYHDTSPPVISLSGPNPQQIPQGAAYSELGATAVDDTSGDISGTIVIDSTAVDTATVGSYTVTYNVQDAAGNAAAEVTRTVVVSTPVLSYVVNGSTVTITDCDVAASGALLIPASIEGKPVTSIGDSAFRDCVNLSSIEIPDSVTSIGNYAFYSCVSMTSISIPESVTSLGASAFRYCTSLVSITIPESITSIGSYTFYGCTSLASITLPDSLISIGNYAFYNCTSLTSATIGNSVTSLGYYAFRNCISLASITLPDSLTSIGRFAFYSCAELRRVHFDGTLPTFGSAPFYLAAQSFITYPGSLTTVAGRPAFDSRHIPVPAIHQLAGGDVCVSFQAAAGPHPSPYRYRVYKSATFDAPLATWVQVGPEIIGADAPVQVDYTPQAGETSLFLRALVEFQ
jgi:hypothetical protein